MMNFTQRSLQRFVLKDGQMATIGKWAGNRGRQFLGHVPEQSLSLFPDESSIGVVSGKVLLPNLSLG
jgi:hypothetical protein